MARDSDSSAKQTVKFTEAEKRFLRRNEVCRVATSYNDGPHVTPVTYIIDHNGSFYFAIDYKSKKYRNLEKNKRIALEVDDTYKSSVNNKAVVVRGKAEFIEKGEEFRRLYNLFYKKFEWVKDDPFKEGEAPFVRVKPLHKVSWGLKK
jgi:nitroimidazol reductase NimA-like FMN-containing flavoprotein (pyridoxamine 5'-phosphate oxidase superfamily)